MTFSATVLTLYPQMFPGALGESLAGKGLNEGLWTLEAHDIRQFGLGRHRSVDDTPSGGGPGMVMRPDVLAKAIDTLIRGEDERPKLLMSPRGMPFDQKLANQWARGPGVIIVCGRFEGVDQRVIDARKLLEVSIGDFVLSGGEVAAHAVLDATVRLIPGIMGNASSGKSESFENCLLEHPQFTRPQTWEDREVPAVLTSGNHSEIETWKQRESEQITKIRRPDLWKKYEKSANDKKKRDMQQNL